MAGKKLKVAGGIVGSFLALVVLIYTLVGQEILRPVEGGLMVVALFGMYVGFGILIALYRFVNRLE